MTICFIGYTGLKDYSGENNISFAGINYQRNYLTCFSNYPGIKMKAFLIPEVPVFPRNKNIIFKSKVLNGYNVENKSVKFINLPIIKRISVTNSLRSIVKREYENNPDTIFLVYNFDMDIAKAVIGTVPMNQVFCILADLPIFEISNSNFFTNLVKRVRQKNALRLLGYLRNAIIINSNQLDYLPDDIEYLLMEGGVQEEYIIPCKKIGPKGEWDTIMYSGAITEYAGIGLLINACELASATRKIQLLIYGNHKIEKRTVTPNFVIEYKGFADHDEITSAQQKADLLVNPRIINNEISRTTFPSKILEYASSPSQILITKIDGIPEEYFDYIDHCDDNPESMAYMINKILSESEDTKIKKIIQRHDFIRSNKLWPIQIEKVVNFIGKSDNKKFLH